jgi:hypothetical protein
VCAQPAGLPSALCGGAPCQEAPCQQVSLSLLPAGQPLFISCRSTYYFCQHAAPSYYSLLSTFYFASRSASNYCSRSAFEYHSVCPLVRIGTPLPLPQASVSPRNQRVDVGVPIRTTGESLASCLLCVLCSQYATAYITRSPYQLVTALALQQSFPYWL